MLKTWKQDEVAGKDRPREQSLLLSATAKENLASIACEGLRAGSYWSDDQEVHDYYRDTVEDEGKEPISLGVYLEDLDQSFLTPDQNGIDEPLTYTLGMSEEEVWAAWEETDQSWSACLELISTVRYDAVIPPDKIWYAGRRLSEWAKMSTVSDG